MSAKKKIILIILFSFLLAGTTGSILTLQTMEQMGDHRKKIISFWGGLYDVQSESVDNEKIAQNPPEGLKEELRIIFQRVYLPHGGPSISKSLAKVCLENPVDLLPLFVSPKGDMSVLCGISEPYEVLPITLPDNLPSGVIAGLSETKPNYFDPDLLAFHKLKVTGTGLDPAGIK